MKPPRRRPLLLLALGLLAASLTFIACRPKITAPPEPPLAVRLGDDAFRLQDYEAAIEDYRVYIDSVEHGEYTPLAFYQTALSWYRLEQYEQALDVLSELDRRYPDDHWVQVDALRGDAQYKLGRRSAAVIAWDEGWSVAQPNERPELRRRIVTVLREMDEAELAETGEVVENGDVADLVEHHLAIAQRRDPAPRSTTLRETGVASASVPSRGFAPGSTATARAETESHAGGLGTSDATAEIATAGQVAAEAEQVSHDAEEVARLSDEIDTTGDEVFEAIEQTKEAEEDIRAVDEANAGYAPLLKVDIPEAPFVDRAVPEPKKVIRVAPPQNEPAAAAPAGAQAAAQPDPTIQEVDIVSAPDANLERVEAPAVAAAPAAAPVEEPASDPQSGARVACVLPLTGADRATGESVLRAIRLVFTEGSDDIIFRDSGSDPAATRELVRQLSTDSNVIVAIAPADTHEANGIAGSAERAAVPLLLVTRTTVPKTRYVLPVGTQSGATADEFADQYRARYGAPPDEMSSKAYAAALLARRALQIAPVPRGEVLSRIALLPPPASAPRLSGDAGADRSGGAS